MPLFLIKSVIKNKARGLRRGIGPERSACGKKFYVVSGVGHPGEKPDYNMAAQLDVKARLVGA
jgi:hypothetical protein